MKTNSFISKSVLLVWIALAMQACAVNPQQAELPSVSIPQQYHAQSASDAAGMQQTWWSALGDPVLSDLIARATITNLDIATASARIKAARATMGMARSLSMPDISASSSVAREKISSNGLLGSAPGNAFPETYTLYNTGLDASWELDLFGAHAAQRRKAQAHYSDAVADLYAVRLSLAAEVSRVYIEHCVLAQQLASARQVVNLREQTLALVNEQYAAGQVAAIDVTRARLALEAARIEVPKLHAEKEVREQTMGALLGTGQYVDLPDNSPLLGEPLQSVGPSMAINSGLPADLLRRRPDIRQAEAKFNATTANKDIAVADQYPHISLTSSIGLESLHQGSLFESASKYWSLMPQISLPLFDGGYRKSVVAQRKAEVEEATAMYRKAVVEALSDVEQALLRHRGASESMNTSVTALQHAHELLVQEEARYAQGETSLTQLVDARRQFEIQLQSSLQAKQQILLSFVTLHKALGGEFDAQSIATHNNRATTTVWVPVQNAQLTK